MYNFLINFDNKNSEGFINQLDPRAKIIAAFVLILGIILMDSENVYHVLFYFLFCLLLVPLSRISIKDYSKKILRIYPMIFLVTFLLPFTKISGDTQPLFQWQFVKFYSSGLQRFFEINIKFILIFSVTIILTATTTYTQILNALDAFRLPKWMLAILIYLNRMLTILSMEISRMHLAYESRHVHLSLYNKFRIFAGMSAVFMLRLIERSDRTYLAMISRGFNGEVHPLFSLRWQRRDSAAIGIVLIIVLITTIFL